jgi:hypothetical protein
MIHLAPVEPLVFSLTPARGKAIKDAALGKLQPSFWRSCVSFACAIIQVVIWSAHSMRHGQPAAFPIILLFLVFATGFTMITAIVARLRQRPIPLTGSLAITESGFEGTLDGQPANFRWNEIDGVQDLDGTIVIRRRRGGIIAIPKVDVDAPALWSLFEERLISKRGLIRSPSIRSVIPNTAC